METKVLLAGIAGFLLGGLLVSIAATTFDKPTNKNSHQEMTMSAMTHELAQKNGDAFDKYFLSMMIEHHQAAVDMAKLADKQAKHSEVKQLSRDIISAQQQEIQTMKLWQQNWGYVTDTKNPHAEHEM